MRALSYVLIFILGVIIGYTNINNIKKGCFIDKNKECIFKGETK